MIPRPGRITKILLTWLGLVPSILVLAVGLRAEAFDPATCEQDDQHTLRLKRVANINLDQARGVTDQRRERGRALPPEVISSGIVPPICVTRDALVFTHPESADPVRIPLSDDPSFAKSAVVSRNGRFAALRTTMSHGAVFSPEVMDQVEGGELPITATVYDSSGLPMYTTTGTSEDLVEVTNAGVLLLRSVHTGSLVLSRGTTGVGLPAIGQNIPSGAVSADGSRVAVASVRGMIGTTPVTQVPGIVWDSRLRAQVEVQVVTALFDANGRQQWSRVLPDVNRLDEIAISDDGTRILVSARKMAEKPDFLDSDDLVKGVGFLLDDTGNVLASGERPPWSYSGLHFNPQIQAFDASEWAPGAGLIFPDGRTLLAQPPAPISALRHLAHGVSENLIAAVAVFKRHPFVYITDLSSNVLACRSIQDLFSPPLPSRGSVDGDDLPEVKLSISRDEQLMSVFITPAERPEAPRVVSSISVFRLERLTRAKGGASR